MSDVDKVGSVKALVTSIGENCVEAIGKESLLGLNANLDPREMTCDVTVALRKNSDSEQKRALTALFEIEQLFFEEVVLSFAFVGDIEQDGARLSPTPQFTFA